MRVVFTTDYYPPHIGGGVEAVVNEVASRLVSDGHHVMVVTLGRQGWPRSEILDGVYVHRFQSTRLNRVTGIELTVSLESFRRMTTTIEGFAPDIVNAHHQFFTTTPAALSAARKLGIPSVLTLHIAGLDDFGGWRGAASRIYETALARRLVARADALVAVSQAVAVATELRPGQAVEVIPNGVDLARFRPGDPKTGDHVRFVFVGRLIANKGPDVALEAFRVVNERAANTRLSFVGDGPMLPVLERTVRAHGLEDVVEFLGMRENVAEILRQGHVFVRPSTIEGMPLTILEAMASGLPVIATDVGGVKEIVAHGTTGLVVAPGSAAPVVDAMLELMDPQRRHQMGVAALERVQDEFNWESTAAANLRFFEDVIGTHHD